MTDIEMTCVEPKPDETYIIVDNESKTIEMQCLTKNDNFIENDYHFVDVSEVRENSVKSPTQIPKKINKYVNKIFSILRKREDILGQEEWFEPTI